MSAATITSIEKGTHNGHRYQIVKFAHGAETMACWGDDWGIGADGPDRWSVSCVKHGYGMEFSTYSRAKEESLQPGEWCTCCAEEIKAQAETVEAEEPAQATINKVENGYELDMEDKIVVFLTAPLAPEGNIREIPNWKYREQYAIFDSEDAAGVEMLRYIQRYGIETVEAEEPAQAETVEVEEPAQAFAVGDAVIATYKGAQTRGVIVCEYVCPDHRKGYPDERFYSSPEDPVYVVQERGEEREIAYRASHLKRCLEAHA